MGGKNKQCWKVFTAYEKIEVRKKDRNNQRCYVRFQGQSVLLWEQRLSIVTIKTKVSNSLA